MEHKLATTPEAMKQVLVPAAVSHRDGDRDAFSVGEPVVDRAGDQMIVGHAQKVRLITKSRRKDDRLDARSLAAGANRSQAAEPGEASQCAGAVAPDGDPCTSGSS